MTDAHRISPGGSCKNASRKPRGQDIVDAVTGPPTPRDAYSRLLELRRASLSGAIKRHISFGNLRLASLITGLAVAYLVFGREVITAWWLAMPVAAFIWAGSRLDRAIRDRARLDRSIAFFERALARTDGRWADGGETGESFVDDEHLYAPDLDLFGETSLFQLLTSARTRIGESTLAHWLNSPAAPSVVVARQDAVKELGPRIDLREDLAVLGEAARTGVHPEALAAWGERASRIAASATPIWAWVLTAAGTVALVGLLVWILVLFEVLRLTTGQLAAVRTYVGVMFAIGWAVVLRYRTVVSEILEEVEGAAHDLALLAGVVGRLESERFSCARLATLRAELDTEGLPPSRRISQLDTLTDLVDSRDNVFVRLLGPFVLWDFHLIHAIERWRRTSGPALRRWLNAVGEMEALSSLAAYHFEHPADVFPELSDGPPMFEGEALGHPLLEAQINVRNDVHLGGDLRVLVVSGSNMSGKSTLLRTVGINAVLAQAGAPVRATRLRMTPLAVGASIRTLDSLASGVSRFYAEVTRLGLIMSLASGPRPALFLIDELLHGTNSHDRRIGAEAIVRGLVERGAIGLVTTHDLALAQVAAALGVRAANVHFQDELVDGRMRFDYRMRPGVVHHSNALELMRSVGLEV